MRNMGPTGTSGPTGRATCSRGVDQTPDTRPKVPLATPTSDAALITQK